MGDAAGTDSVGTVDPHLLMEPTVGSDISTINRPRFACALDLPSALGASVCGSIVFILLSYLLLACVPGASGSGLEGFPHGPWIGRFDLAQLLGTIVDPPYPNATSWMIGMILEFCALILLGIAYCFVQAWGMRRASVGGGVVLGVVLYIVLGLTIWTAFGLAPAVMRGAIPDTGFFFLGWSGWASLAILLSSVGFGACVGGIYSRLHRVH